MRRRQVLSTGIAGMAVGFFPIAPAWASGSGAISCKAAVARLAAARRDAGLVVPAADGTLAEAAWRQSFRMADLGAASHLGPRGETPDLRAREAGFPGRVLGETLAETFDDPDATMAFWLSHPPTRDILMDPAARSFGMAAAGGRDARLWLSLMTGA